MKEGSSNICRRLLSGPKQSGEVMDAEAGMTGTNINQYLCFLLFLFLLFVPGLLRQCEAKRQTKMVQTVLTWQP
jgi:hypothetical protein